MKYSLKKLPSTGAEPSFVAAVAIPQSRSSTCGGVPGELQQADSSQGHQHLTFRQIFNRISLRGKKEGVWITGQHLQTGPVQGEWTCEPMGQAGCGGWLACNRLPEVH